MVSSGVLAKAKSIFIFYINVANMTKIFALLILTPGASGGGGVAAHSVVGTVVPVAHRVSVVCCRLPLRLVVVAAVAVVGLVAGAAGPCVVSLLSLLTLTLALGDGGEWDLGRNSMLDQHILDCHLLLSEGHGGESRRGPGRVGPANHLEVSTDY